MKIKYLTMAAVVAVIALTLASTSLASAATFNTEKSPANLRASQSSTLKFAFNAMAFTCNTATFEGIQASTSSSTMSLAPNLQECKWSGINMQVERQGCNFVYRADTVSTGGVSVSCPTGSAIRILGPGCTVRIGSQERTGLGGIKYTGEGSGASRKLLVEHSLTGIRYTQEGVFCNANGSFTNGTLTGTTRTEALSEANAGIGLWVS